MPAYRLTAASAVLLAAALVPLPALALAGLAEHSRTYHFNRLAELRWSNPGDGCEGDDKFCLELVRASGEGFADIGESLEAVNVPVDPSSPYVVAQRSSDLSWLVYDLAAGAFLVERARRDEALAAWRGLGLAAPRLVDAHGPDRHLEETAASREQRWRERTIMKIYFELPPLLVAALLFGAIALGLARDYRRTGSRVRLALCVVFGLPAALALLRILSSIGESVTARVLGT